MPNGWRLTGILAAWLAAPGIACAASFQFEVMGVSEAWMVVRENIRATAADTAACTYPGLDPSEYVGANVHFVRLSPEQKRGRLTPLEKTADAMPLYSPGHQGEGCTAAAEADRRRLAIVAHAKQLGIEMPAAPPAAVLLGAPVPAKSCVLLGGVPVNGPPCKREFRQVLKDGTIRIAVALTAIPEAPDLKACQFLGHRFGVAIQVSGLDFGTMESDTAPGGFANHYDCRSQQFDPLRWYVMNGIAVLVGGFSGTNLADREEHPFVVVFPARKAG